MTRRWMVAGLAVLAAATAACSSSKTPTGVHTASGGGASTGASTAGPTTTTTAPAAAHGVEAPVGAVPWAQVGPGWMLATWSPAIGLGAGEQPPAGQPTFATATTTLYLVDPAGGRYAITTFPASQNGPPGLVDWSGDGHHALLVGATGGQTAGTVVTQVDLTTGAQTNFTVELDVDATYSRPDGEAILLSTGADTAGATTLERVDLGGTEQLVYPTDTLGETFTGGFLSTPDGTQLVLGTAKGLILVGNDGTPGRDLPIAGEQTCTPERWWAPSVVLAQCSDTGSSRLWEVPLSGAAPTALTAPLSGQAGPDLGDEDAWQLPSGTYLQDAGACGYQYLAKLDAVGGTTTPVTVPDVDNGSSVYVIGTTGDDLVLHATVSCGGGQSLLVYDPVANTSSVVLGPPLNGGGVLAALLYPTQ